MPKFNSKYKRKRRTSSVGSYTEEATTTKSRTMSFEQVQALLKSLMYMTSDHSNTNVLHQAASETGRSLKKKEGIPGGQAQKDEDDLMLYLAHCLLERCAQVDECFESEQQEDKNTARSSLTELFLSQGNDESQYTPLHQAIVHKNLAVILLYVKHAIGGGTNSNHKNHLTPMQALQSLQEPKDAEGFSPLDLLNHLSKHHLSECRRSLEPDTLKESMSFAAANSNSSSRRGRSGSFHLLNESTSQDNDEEEASAIDSSTRKSLSKRELKDRYACEVVSFGRPHHCALGVVTASSSTKTTNRPRRVQEFAQEQVGRAGAAIAVAAATHHTLVACRNGHVYAFGLDKGGRLGLGDSSNSSSSSSSSSNSRLQCPLPRRILGPLKSKRVKAVAAAENHSLCITTDGLVWAWGSNQFGQLGCCSSTNNNDHHESSSGSSSSLTNSSRSLPKIVEELKGMPCKAVSAGERHSVALTEDGQVYVWGSNASGQLGVVRRSGNQKVQRVEALWGGATTSKSGGSSNNSYAPEQRKIALAIDAAEQSTLVLTAPSRQGGARVNSVYWWGHGNHAPMRVPFDKSSTAGKTSEGNSSLRSHRWINPVAIACGKYHNVAVTSDGHVYSWGTSSESLGHQGKSPSGRITPTRVIGMLPENGGGFAVSVAASDQHTAVVTDTGALFTWGVAHEKNAMGHEGVRWQPDPKRVPGVHRAVQVAVAKEHTIVLQGSYFPTIPPRANNSLASLEELSARAVIPHVDLFNVIPILIMAEHSQCDVLINYCNEFVHHNLDGVLNVGKKSVLAHFLNHRIGTSKYNYMNTILHENESSSGRTAGGDRTLHSFVEDIITAGNDDEEPSFYNADMSSVEEWIQSCQEISETDAGKLSLALAGHRERTRAKPTSRRATGRSISCASESDISCSSRDRSSSVLSHQGVLDRAIRRTANLDLSTSKVASEQSLWLGKEIRSVRKKLSQISRLQESEAKAIVLTPEEQTKVARLPIFESELQIYETALEEVEKRIRELSLERKPLSVEGQEKKKSFDHEEDLPMEEEAGADSKSESVFLCEICCVKCPDKKSFELHQNGRKHRNRVSQAAEHEEQKAAESIMAQKQLEGLKNNMIVPPTSRKVQDKNAWGTSSSTSTPQPKFKLPPPIHPVVSHVSSLPSKPSPSLPTVTLSLSLKVPPPAPAIDFAAVLREQESSASKVTTPRKSPPSSKKIRSPSWAPTGTSPGPAYSLSDFLSPPKAPPSPSSSKKDVTWNCPVPQKRAAGDRSRVTGASPKAKSLAEIQAEEEDFKNKEDRAFKSRDKEGRDSRWFIERRERAGSLHAIQQAEEEERQHQLLVQEQLEIEAQIQKQLQAERQQSKKQASKGKRNSKSRTKGNGQRPKQQAAEASGQNPPPSKPSPRKTHRTPGKKKPGSTSRANRHA